MALRRTAVKPLGSREPPPKTFRSTSYRQRSSNQGDDRFDFEAKTEPEQESHQSQNPPHLSLDTAAATSPSTPRFDYHVPSSQTSPTSLRSASGSHPPHHSFHRRTSSGITGGPPPNVLTPPVPPPEYSFSDSNYDESQSPSPPLPAVSPPRHRSSANDESGYNNNSIKKQQQFPKSHCSICHDKLRTNQRVVKTDYGTIHNDCFRCNICDESLEHSQFYFSEMTQKIYCHLDYHQLFSPLCGYCNTPVESDGIFALNKHWHNGHFFCADCSEPFSGTDNYYVKDGHTLCENCHLEKMAIKCWKCQYKCSPMVIEALGRQWCNSCFSCEECTTPFENNEFILRQDGTLVCHICEARRIKQECWA